jgi:hypothetical protein
MRSREVFEMKSVLGFIVLAFGLAACAVDADSIEDKTLPAIATEVSVSELDSPTAIDESATTAACARIWECRDCGNFRTQNILVDVCTGEVVRARGCGEPCF